MRIKAAVVKATGQPFVIDEINKAAADSEKGAVLKAVLCPNES